MPRAKKPAATKKPAAAPRRGRPPAKKAPGPKNPAPKPGPGYEYRWISQEVAEGAGLIVSHEAVPTNVEVQAVELALVRLRRIAASLRLATLDMDEDHHDAVTMAAELINGVHEAIDEALDTLRQGR